jgi:hypothetical protein
MEIFEKENAKLNKTQIKICSLEIVNFDKWYRKSRKKQ